MDRPPNGLTVIGWLFVLHALADVAVALYRSQTVDPVVDDILCAALPRSQVCLLAAWLAVGSQRWSWRFCGTIVGVCFVFILFSRFVFLQQKEIGHGTVWLDDEWAQFFRLWGPGDLLIKMPLLLGGVVLPLWIWRLGRWIGTGASFRLPKKWPRLQFRTPDVAVWMITICATLAALYQTAPYPEWTVALGDQWWSRYDFELSMTVYSTASTSVYVMTTLVALWFVHWNARLWLRVAVLMIIVVLPAMAMDGWLRSIVEAKESAGGTTDGLAAYAETITSAIAATVIVGSLAITDTWKRLIDRLKSSADG